MMSNLKDKELTLKARLDDLYMLIHSKPHSDGMIYRLECIMEMIGMPIPNLEPKPEDLLPKAGREKPPPQTLGPKPNTSGGKPGLS